MPLPGVEVYAQGTAAGPPLGLMGGTIEGLMVPERWSAVFELPGK